MGRLFGYQLEADFDSGKEQRRNHLWWLFLSGLVLCLVCLFFMEKISATQIFQGWVATSLFYGENFYVRQKLFDDPWLWKAMLATIPLHVCLMTGLFWLDMSYPSVTTKAVVFLPAIVVILAFETILAERIIGSFKPAAAKAPLPQQGQ
jgi:hypothetical protein